MKLALLALLGLLGGQVVWAHPHEWVDWGVGLAVENSSPYKVVSARLELTWDEWLSALILTDFPGMADNTLKAADLRQLDTAYGLASPDRAVSLTVTFQGKPLPVKLVMEAPRYDGKQATLIYTFPLGVRVDAVSELRVELYDPTYYTDMGIRSKTGGFLLGKKDLSQIGSVKFAQDQSKAYYGGSVFPEVVVFTLKP